MPKWYGLQGLIIISNSPFYHERFIVAQRMAAP
jgi:hypothetical protein